MFNTASVSTSTTATSAGGKEGVSIATGGVVTGEVADSGLFSALFSNVLRDLALLQPAAVASPVSLTTAEGGGEVVTTATTEEMPLPLDGNGLPLLQWPQEYLLGAQPPIVDATNPSLVFLSGGVAGGAATSSTRTLLTTPLGVTAEEGSTPLTPQVTPLLANMAPPLRSELAAALASNPMVGSSGDALYQGLTTEVKGITSLVDEEALLKNIGLSTPRTSDLFTLQTPPLAAERVALAASSTTPSVTVHTPLHQPGWSDELGGQVTWMVKQNLHTAEIKLNPAQLGPIEVKIAMHQDQATITLAAAHGVTRDALEAALPRLREMFADAGINVANANVFSQTPQGGQGGREQPGQENPNAAIVSQEEPGDGAEEGTVTHITTTGALGGLDLFA